ncbi:hypothetical protein VHEMI09570 [[Torrubiella] hemipterigena]|uniref:Uncharacterized protein n=1 Tax=[Torrubiella] hemipterigena TaxID=1531966 RepID=A0A0A1TQJ1_9HYPO|nr:hypothetical protein VHEMI09570 [[Torrubiella] hemipterigena]
MMDDASRPPDQVLALIALELVFGLVSSSYGYKMRQALVQRQNIPKGARWHILGRETPDFHKERRYWVADIVFPENLVIRFGDSFMYSGVLPSGRRTDLPLPDWDPLMIYFLNPTFSWAPEPFRDTNVSFLEIREGMRKKRQITASQELITMKRRIMAGIMPISERRWVELGLDGQDKFDEACSYICSVIDVFHYLNTPGVKRILRESFNFVWESMDTLDKALRAAGKAIYSSDISLAGLWHEYIKDYYEFIARRAHRWVIEHIERLRALVLPLLSDRILTYAPTARAVLDFVLADRIHDLGMSVAQADTDICIPMDGYHGETLPSQDHLEPDTENKYRMEPIRFSANAKVREADYFARVKYIFRIETKPDPKATGSKSAQEQALDQAKAQEIARNELRGPQRQDPEQELWVTAAKQRNNPQVKYKGYRISPEHDDEEWEKFKAKLEEDMSGWESGLVGVDEIREKCIIEWIDARDIVSEQEGASDGLLSILRHFGESQKTMVGFQTDAFVVANHVVINSYLDPSKHESRHIVLGESTSSAEGRRFASQMEPPVLPHPYQGWLRVPGNLFWDDFMPMQLMRAETMPQLWRLTLGDGIYRHALGPAFKPEEDNDASLYD